MSWNRHSKLIRTRNRFQKIKVKSIQNWAGNATKSKKKKKKKPTSNWLKTDLKNWPKWSFLTSGMNPCLAANTSTWYWMYRWKVQTETLQSRGSEVRNKKWSRTENNGKWKRRQNVGTSLRIGGARLGWLYLGDFLGILRSLLRYFHFLINVGRVYPAVLVQRSATFQQLSKRTANTKNISN